MMVMTTNNISFQLCDQKCKASFLPASNFEKNPREEHLLTQPGIRVQPWPLSRGIQPALVVPQDSQEQSKVGTSQTENNRSPRSL